MHRRLAVLALQAVAVLAHVGGTLAFVALDKTVTLSVDGEQRTVRSFARTVGDLLSQQRITTGPRDIVAPAAATTLADGDRVSVRYARRILLTVDGQLRELWVTAQSVQEALDQLGVRAQDAYVSASRSARIGRAGLALTVRTARDVTVVADGRRRLVRTTALTVADVLTATGLAVRPADRLSVPVTAFPVDGQTVTLTRVDVRRVTSRRAVSFRTVQRRTDALYTGQTNVSRSGRAGVEVSVYEETYLDKRLATRRLVARTLTVRPLDRVVLVGTRSRPAAPPAQSTTRTSRAAPAARPLPPPTTAPSHRASADGLNWAALARCESGGNPRAVNPAGYYGLYQFSPSTWRSVGGSGMPHDASPDEQTYRAQLLYRRTGASSWPTCGRYLFT